MIRKIAPLFAAVLCLVALALSARADLATIPYQGILNHTWLNSLVGSTDIITDLRGFVGTTVPSSDGGNTGSEVYVRGLSAAGDGGGGLYYWNSTSTAADDGLNVIEPTVSGFSGTGRWLREFASNVLITGGSISNAIINGGSMGGVAITGGTILGTAIGSSTIDSSALTNTTATTQGVGDGTTKVATDAQVLGATQAYTGTGTQSAMTVTEADWTASSPGAAITVPLPASPNDHDCRIFVNATGQTTWPMQVSGNGKTIGPNGATVAGFFGPNAVKLCYGNGTGYWSQAL